VTGEEIQVGSLGQPASGVRPEFRQRMSPTQVRISCDPNAALTRANSGWSRPRRTGFLPGRRCDATGDPGLRSQKDYTGLAPLEAAGLAWHWNPTMSLTGCNLVTLRRIPAGYDGEEAGSHAVMEGLQRRKSTRFEAKELIYDINEQLGTSRAVLSRRVLPESHGLGGGQAPCDRDASPRHCGQAGG